MTTASTGHLASADTAWDRAVRAHAALGQMHQFTLTEHAIGTDRTVEQCRSTSCCADGCRVEYCTSCGQIDVGAQGCTHRELLDWLMVGVQVLGASLPASSDEERLALSREAALAHYAAFVEHTHSVETAMSQGTVVLFCGSCQDSGPHVGTSGCAHQVKIREFCTRVGVTPAFLVPGPPNVPARSADVANVQEVRAGHRRQTLTIDNTDT